MYRTVLYALGVLAVLALVLSLFGHVGPGPIDLLASAVVLVAVGAGVDVLTHRIIGTPWRWESTLITAGILLFVMWPEADALTLLGTAIAAAAASLSKVVLAWRGRHVLNPAAVGATVAALLSLAIPGLGLPSWWVATPWLFVPLVVLALLVAWRTERVLLVAAFYAIAVVLSAIHIIVNLTAAGSSMLLSDLVKVVVVQSPFLFLGAFMLTEPLTLPARRWQRWVVMLVVALLAGWTLKVAGFSLGQERALLIGNLVAFALVGARRGIRLTLRERREVVPGTTEVTFAATGLSGFRPGQYLELDVPHAHADARGTRREFSLVSSPAELPTVRIAYRDGSSSFKRALAAVSPGEVVRATGVWGDFTVRADGPALLVAAGIGITPFLSQLRTSDDTVLVFVGAALPYADEIRAAGIPVLVPSAPELVDGVPELVDGVPELVDGRLTAESLQRLVPDLAARRAYISGPPGLIADLAPALRGARSLTTDAFSGY
ncbi:MAG: FAD-dependent oxidoreductase [Microbacterium sp.]